MMASDNQTAPADDYEAALAEAELRSHRFRAKRVGRAAIVALEQSIVGHELSEGRQHAPPISEDADLESVWIEVGEAALAQALEEGWRKPTTPYGEPEPDEEATDGRAP